MEKIKKIISPILLGVMMSLCLVVVVQAEEILILESDENTDVSSEEMTALESEKNADAQNPVIPTLENSIEQEAIEGVAVEETTTEVPEKNMEPENIPQSQDDYASMAKMILIGASIVALLVLVASKLYNRKRKKGIKN